MRPNNSISKVFTNIWNERLNSLVEKLNLLGQIQNGFRRNRRGTGSLFVLWTIMEKASQSGSPQLRELELLFIDLTKAYDRIPRDLLWSKMEMLGLGGKFLKVIKALYKNDNFQVSINGYLSEKVFPKRGLKQGCVLSILPISIYQIRSQLYFVGK